MLLELKVEELAKSKWGALYNDTSENAMAYGIHAQQYTFLDESGEGLTDTTDAISYTSYFVWFIHK